MRMTNLFVIMLAAGCSGVPSAPSPTLPVASSTSLSAAAMADAPGLSPEHLQAIGWDCRPAPFNPTRTTCSHPNQPHPASFSGPPPPADRPASISLRVFDNGVFAGTSVLIRSDLYSGQTCRSTGLPYTLIARIGYYECLHPQGRD
jgi:hypothetical protein